MDTPSGPRGESSGSSPIAAGRRGDHDGRHERHTHPGTDSRHGTGLRRPAQGPVGLAPGSPRRGQEARRGRHGRRPPLRRRPRAHPGRLRRRRPHGWRGPRCLPAVRPVVQVSGRCAAGPRDDVPSQGRGKNPLPPHRAHDRRDSGRPVGDRRFRCGRARVGHHLRDVRRALRPLPAPPAAARVHAVGLHEGPARGPAPGIAGVHDDKAADDAVGAPGAPRSSRRLRPNRRRGAGGRELLRL